MLPTTTPPTTLPERDELHALYDEEIAKLNVARGNDQLVNPFYTETAESVFAAGYMAIEDRCKDGPSRVHVVSSPAGSGKTSFSYAFMVALTRYADSHPEAHGDSVFVVDQKEKADKVFRDLEEMLPGRIGIWSTDHDKEPKTPRDQRKVTEPAARFTQDELRLKSIIVVTHAFYNTSKGMTKSHQVRRNGTTLHNRALVIVDERPEEVPVYDTTLKQAQYVKEQLEQSEPTTQAVLDRLLEFMMPYTLDIENNQISRPPADPSLQWFTTKEAERILKAYKGSIGGLDQLFGFARALTRGCAFTVKEASVVSYVGWERKLIVCPGTMLLDATADIDGVSLLCPHREHVRTPQARYDDLEIRHVPPHTKANLKRYLEKAANQYAYVDYMVSVIKKHMNPGDRALVVCKKTLIDNQRVPQWPARDPKFDKPKAFTENYGWDLGDDKKVCVKYWGTGIGSNDCKFADVVFLFDEYHIPRRVAAATTQGLQGLRADQGDLGDMTSIKRKSYVIDIIADGHRLRHTKQMGLRGNGRNYNENGVSGEQRLVISSDRRSFMANVERLFPGAKVTTFGVADDSTQGDKVIEILRNADGDVVRTKEITKALGKPWRVSSSNVLTEDFVRTIRSFGWEYRQGKGCKGSWFERAVQSSDQAA